MCARVRARAQGRACVHTGYTYISVAAIDYFTHRTFPYPRRARAPHSRRRDASYRARYRRYIAALYPLPTLPPGRQRESPLPATGNYPQDRKIRALKGPFALQVQVKSKRKHHRKKADLFFQSDTILEKTVAITQRRSYILKVIICNTIVCFPSRFLSVYARLRFA